MRSVPVPPRREPAARGPLPRPSRARPPAVRGAAALLAALVVFPGPFLAAAPDEDEPWRRLSSGDGSAATARHEAGAVAVDGKLYLLGGRGIRPLEVYDPDGGTWRDLGALPDELHHFQPVAIGTRIYIVGAMRCCYPNEPTERTVHVYDTVAGSWSTAGEMPLDRARGGGGAVVRDGRIYLVGGNTRGHDGGAVGWFDEFDPASGTWRTLPDAPEARDHFTAVLVGDRLVAAGGRRTDLPVPFDKAVAATDVYDFGTGAWSTGAAIPTPRAGTVGYAAEGEVVVAGGEIADRDEAYATVESYVVAEDRWRTLQPLLDARHGGGGVRIGDTLHMVGGSRRRGGGPETSSHETLALAGDGSIDSDGDGLDDASERDVWMTDPTRADTDGDELGDGDEAARGTDPLLADSDADGLSDGEEVLRRATAPLVADSDGDGLDDGTEVLLLETDPLLADSDGDGLGDKDEVDGHGTDPLAADSDGDGLDDRAELLEHGTDPRDPDSDGDGLDDRAELVEHGTDPREADGDADGLADGAEVLEHGTDPLAADSDEDGLGDGAEVLEHGTDPLDADSDDDGAGDGVELVRGSDPLAADGSGAEPAASGGGGGGALWWLLGALGVTGPARRGVRTAGMPSSDPRATREAVQVD